MSDKADFVAQVWERAGVCVLPEVSPDEYPTIPDMEGPFRFGRDRDFQVLYYDSHVGEYYDRKTDMYVKVG